MVFPRRKTLSSSARRTVSDDWITVLPGEKGELFDTVVGRWECTYAMMSVALDDALSLRSRGELVCARQQVAVAADLLESLAASLTSFCNTLQRRGRALSILPAVKPLNATFFRGNTAQSAASWNELIHHVLFRGRSRFFNKVRILSEMLLNLEHEFRDAAGDIAKGMDTQPITSWIKLDDLHYDFNTCLRETEVVLKSFLRAFPSEQLPGLALDLDAAPEAKRRRLNPRLSGAPA